MNTTITKTGRRRRTRRLRPGRGGLLTSGMVMAFAAACSTPDPDPATAAPTSSATTSSATTAGGSRTPGTTATPEQISSAHAPSDVEPQGSRILRIRLSVGDRSAVATLADNPTARDFAALLR